MPKIINHEPANSVRAKLNATGLRKTYSSVAELLNATDAIAEGELVAVPMSGHWYIGAASAASDPHLTTAGGAKLYVLPENDACFSFGAWGPDDTGADDVTDLLNAALDVVLRSGVGTLLIPGGVYRLEGEVQRDLTRGQKLTLRGTGATKLHQTNGAFSIRTASFLTTSLAERVEAEEVECVLKDVTGLEVGDLLLFRCDENLETEWNDDKIDLRRITRIDGATVWVNKPFRWPHDPTDTNHQVLAHWPAECHMDGIDVIGAADETGGTAFGYFALTDGSMRNGSFSGGAVAGTDSAFTEGPTVSRCYGVEISLNISNARYAPSLSSSFGCRFSDAAVKGVGHCDMSAWSEDCVVENVIGIQTQGLVQSRSNTGGIFRNITDGVSDDALSGFDLRGLGETVEHCRTTSVAPAGTVNTCAPLLKDQWLPYARKYTRRVSDFYAPHATIAFGKDGRNTFERIRVWETRGNRFEADQTRVTFDPACVFLNRTVGRKNDKLKVEQRLPETVPMVSHYRSDAPTLDITSITQTTPAVITAGAHGLTDGDVVWVWGGDMPGIGGYFTVANAAADTFELAVDATGFPAYTSGGKVTRQAATECIELNFYPAVGQLTKSHVIAKLAEDLTDASPYTLTFLYRPFTQDTVDEGGANIRLTIRAGTNVDYSEAVFHVSMHTTNNTAEITPISDFDSKVADLDISDVTVTPHFKTNVEAEGCNNWAEDAGGRNYLQIAVTLASPERINWVTADIEGWRGAIMPNSSAA
ncbi:hypothetical protein [Tropicimonas isoalkanivorans]|uniref:Pectate lyase superfamily protein n=1 Tax=Tropicimonas isoalkanivorans TaxID=441112 RepID=A0A1I1H8U2_9RHOB|nr:hypothetical protein [Tropicimonas isoalkanivorans]SFC20417.1 hypothetical protein SAMN04488094_10368 [Tropicimonas isoalkanivorans]